MNHLGQFWFYLFSAVAVSSSLLVVASRRPAYSVLALTLTMVALSALFVLLEAYFVAVVQVLIYAGAILVLFLFVIMLLGVEGAEQQPGKEKSIWIIVRPAAKLILAVLLFAELAFAAAQMKLQGTGIQGLVGNVEAVGEALFSRYLLPFELVSGILLIGIFGVVNLAYQEKRKTR